MMIKTTILTLLMIFTLSAGDDDRLVQNVPEFHIHESYGTPTYSCQFQFQTVCLWFIDGRRITIDSFGYKWKKGNGSHINDCSIEGKSRYTRPLHGNNSELKVECAGIEPSSFKVELGDSIELKCPLAHNDRCTWKRNGQCIEIVGRYKYFQNNDSSIRIDGIERVDAATWTCSHKRNRWRWPIASYTLISLNSTDQTSVESEEITDENPVSATPTVAVSELTTVRTHAERPSSSNALPMSPTVVFVLGIVGIISSVSMTIGVY